MELTLTWIHACNSKINKFLGVVSLRGTFFFFTIFSAVHCGIDRWWIYGYYVYLFPSCKVCLGFVFMFTVPWSNLQWWLNFSYMSIVESSTIKTDEGVSWWVGSIPKILNCSNLACKRVIMFNYVVCCSAFFTTCMCKTKSC